MERLREKLDLRLALTIAGGIFGGLTLYRLFMWTHEWWADLGSDVQSNFLGVGMILAIAVGMFLGVRWTLRKFKPRPWVIAASVLSAAVLVIGFAGIYHRLAVARRGNQYLDMQTMQPIK